MDFRKKSIGLKVALMLAVMLLLALPLGSRAEAYADYIAVLDSFSVDSGILPYMTYIGREGIKPQAEIRIEADAFSRYEEAGIACEPERGADNAGVRIGEDALITYDFVVEEAGFYGLGIDYYPIMGKSGAIQRAVFIDGALPYRELALVEYPRVWQNAVTEDAIDENGVRQKKWEMDNQGNDMKPTMVEAPQWMRSGLYDSSGYNTGELLVFLSRGAHSLTMISTREPMLLGGIAFRNLPEIKTYEEVLALQDAADKTASKGQVIRIEAENADRTSSQMLYPVSDQSSSAVYPSSAKALKNNTIGGNSWRINGQWLEWDFVASEAGYYEIALHVRQNFQRGVFVSRKITIDGVVPFKEMEAYGFSYTQNWRTDVLKSRGGEPFLFYLEKGNHSLRMESVLGEFANIVSRMQEIVYDLNAVYRRVIRITGVVPDIYRDYQIESNLPGLNDELDALRLRLDEVIADLNAVAGERSDKDRVLITMRDQLNELIKDNERFTKVMSSFRINVRACGTWITQVIQQPLQLDSIILSSPDAKVQANHAPWYEAIGYEMARLYYSFVIDYNQIGNVAEASADATGITLWIGSGRDQAGVIKSLIDKAFTSVHGINVNVMLVDMGTLLQATLAGQGPDVAVFVGNDLPLNYGLRNAVADLRQFADLDEVKKRFNQSAMTPLEFDGHTFGLPETQTFPMMFYRKDILKELGIALPDTWDDVKVIMTALAQNQMEFGMVPSEALFATILYQNGGEYYTKDATRSALDTDEAINAFRIYSNYYTDYKLDKETSVEERFRTGESPIIIADYTTYNNFQVSAPDIKGLWGFAAVPGTLKADGTVDRTVASGGSACVMMDASKEKEAAWEFLKWWTMAETQTLYGREMESLMGAAARVPTANIAAFQNLPWPVADREALESQFAFTRGIPQVPGGYFTYRNVGNAFYRVTTKTDTVSPREELMDKIILINDEIRYKRIEFGLPLGD